MSERSIVPVLKTGERKLSVGSNPTEPASPSVVRILSFTSDP